eukprot:2988627-Amphidinium_carterae.1
MVLFFRSLNLLSRSFLRRMRSASGSPLGIKGGRLDAKRSTRGRRSYLAAARSATIAHCYDVQIEPWWKRRCGGCAHSIPML